MTEEFEVLSRFYYFPVGCYQINKENMYLITSILLLNQGTSKSLISKLALQRKMIFKEKLFLVHSCMRTSHMFLCSKVVFSTHTVSTRRHAN